MPLMSFPRAALLITLAASVTAGFVLVSTACGGPVQAVSASFDGGPALDAGPAVDAGRVVGPPVCTMQITGAFDLSPQCTCYADLSGTPEAGTLTMVMDCRTPDHQYIPFQMSIDVDASTPPGAYPSTNQVLEIEDWGDADASAATLPAFYSTGAPGLCTMTLDTFAPATRGGLAAHVACPGFKDFEDGTKKIDLSVDIRMPEASDTLDGGPDAAGPTGTDAGANTCRMSVTGAYTTVAPLAGEAVVFASGLPDVYASCSIQQGELQLSGSSTGLLQVAGRSWCEGSCTSEYGGACTTTASHDDGTVGGTFIGGFECPELVAADGTTLAVSATIDGIISAAPQ
jgi:hypothetical protein